MIPPCGMPRFALKRLKPAGGHWMSQHASAMDHNVEFIVPFFACAVLLPAQDPLLTALVPLQGGDLGLELDLVVNVVGLGGLFEVGVDLVLVDKLFGKVIVGGKGVAVEVGGCVGLTARVGVAEPGAANVGLELKDGVGGQLEQPLQLNSGTDARKSIPWEGDRKVV